MNTTTPLPPGPDWHPIRQLLHYSFRPFGYLEACARYGETFTFRLAGFGTLVQFTRPEDIREIFRGDSAALHAGEGNALLAALVGDTSVLVLDDAPHVRQRRILLPPLKGERMRQFFAVMQSEALAVCEDWVQRCAGSGEVRADVAMQHVTLRVILRAVLGDEGTGDADFDELEQSMGRLLKEVRHPLLLVMHNLFPPQKWKDSDFLPFYRLRRRFDARLAEIITARRALAPDQRAPCLLTDLLELRHADDCAMSDVEIRDAIVTILAAGHDTTALSLAWALALIVPRADVVAKIEAELADVCAGALPDEEQINAMPYLDAVIRESLRVRNILPFVVRVVKSPVTVGGRTYPPGVILCPSIHLLHKRADLYPDPDAFNPDRFLEKKFGPHEWNPFGGGNRACLGQAFALYEMRVVLATLFSRLRLERPAGAISKPARRGIAVGPHDGTRLIARRREALDQRP